MGHLAWRLNNLAAGEASVYIDSIGNNRIRIAIDNHICVIELHDLVDILLYAILVSNNKELSSIINDIADHVEYTSEFPEEAKQILLRLFRAVPTKKWMSVKKFLSEHHPEIGSKDISHGFEEGLYDA